MDLEELEATLDEIRPERSHDEWGLRLIMAMVGNISSGLMRIESVTSDMEGAVSRSGHTEEEILDALEMAKRDMIGALFVAVAEFAHEQDISVAQAIEERIEHMKKTKQARQRVARWKEAGLTDDDGQVDTSLDSEDDWTFM